VILFLHNRYRTSGGEERVVRDLLWLVREHMHEQAELLARDSSTLERRDAALGLMRGGLDPQQVAATVRGSGARVVHAHNLLPSFGWRALAAARGAGARVVLHLHQYRLVCATGVCFTRGRECTRCHGRNTLPGVLLNCRGSRPEAGAYAAALSLWQQRMLDQADVVLVPSRFALERLRALGAPLPWERVRVLAPPLRLAAGGEAGEGMRAGAGGLEASAEARGDYALVVSRLSPEKGVEVAIEACSLAGRDLVIAGEGPERARLERLAARASTRVSVLGGVDDARLERLRAGAAVALAPSRSAETFGLALAEAMAAGVPAVGSRVGALPELLEARQLVDPGDAGALAEAIERIAGDRDAGERGRARVRAICAPEVVAAGLAEVYRP
jgi:glycosyltransferase involved in cell wall biosynthesis